uniref:DSBA-like thioredoxin domain-containing protein n=1 Tax=Alexandrium monilatum TaxID=311494 RepID=A0A7S4PSJ8_9DINO|mmetsp:Transcript_64649/g.192623  ORF Transcript_64649/g.192623 Transcript_64649/m.192623 type:complete len:172 (+) Transcript_64649:193-708(+)
MIDPNTKESGESKQAYCRKRGWGGGWKPPNMREWSWWPNTLNAHRVCVALEEMDANNPDLTQRQRDQRGLDLVKKYYELTYERDINISTPEGAAQAMEELGYAKGADVVKWLKEGGGFEKVVQQDTFAKRDMDIHGVPHFVISDGSGNPVTELHGAQHTAGFLAAFSKVKS